MRKLVLSVVGLALVASPALAAPGKYNRVIGVGEKAPAFSSIPAIDGENPTTLSIDGIKEDVVVLVFLANHCPYVVAAEDRLIDFANDYKGKSVKLIGISATAAPGQRDSDDLDAIRERIKEKGYNYVYGYDESQKIAKDFGATNTPQIFVLDKDRVIRYQGKIDNDNDLKSSTDATENYLRDAVDALLAGKEVQVKETQPVGCGIQILGSNGGRGRGRDRGQD